MKLPTKVKIEKVDSHTTVIDCETDEEIQGISTITWDLKDGKPPHVRVVFFAEVGGVSIDPAQQSLPLEPNDRR